MARSFHRSSSLDAVEDYTNKNTFYHKASDSYFTMLRRRGKQSQRRYQIGFDGKETNVLLYSIIILSVSIALMWFQMRAATMNPASRPLLVNTSGRMALVGLTRLLTTAAGVIGVWYSTGWLSGILTFIASDIIRLTLRKRYTMASIRALTHEILRCHQEENLSATRHLDSVERLKIAREAATKTVKGWIRGEN